GHGPAVLAVAPRATRAAVVLTVPTRAADHGTSVRPPPSAVNNVRHHGAPYLPAQDHARRRLPAGLAPAAHPRRVHPRPRAPGRPVRDGLAQLPPALLRDRGCSVRRTGPGRRARAARRAGPPARRG